MICPLCGKLSPDSNTLCMYCGTAQIRDVPLFRDAEKYRSHPEEQAGRVYEIHDTTEFEWGCYVAQNRTGKAPGPDSRRIPEGPHEWPPVSDSDAGDPSAGNIRQPENADDRLPPIHENQHQCHESPAPEPVAEAASPAAKPFPQAYPRPQPALPGKQAVPSPAEAPAPPQSGPAKSPSSPSPDTGSAPPPQKKRVRMVSEVEMLKAVLAGRYDIIRTLGTGGMATVYLAHEIALDRDVAIKVLPQVFLRDKQFVNRFKREARLAARLEHPNIVRIYRIGEEPRLCYFVMSYIPGGTLAERIKTYGALPVDDIVRWGIDACSALGYAHERGVIHRDLKPDNIMLDYDGRAIVMDFGIAHAVEGTNLTRSGALIGTPQYMSPDQAMGHALDARSDIYSFGMVLYKMTAGKLPFKSKDPLSLMYMHVNKTPQPPDVLNPMVPSWLRDIILTCIAKRPEDRFGSAFELREALIARKPLSQRFTLPMAQETPTRSGSGLIDAAAHMLSGAFSGFRVRR